MNATSSPCLKSANEFAPKTTVFVIGAHRSGTSVVARSLMCLGVNLGCNFIEPNADNPLGFFENSKVVNFNDSLLKFVGACWDFPGEWVEPNWEDSMFDSWREEAKNIICSEYKDQSLVGIKDPRFCLLLSFWTGLFENWFESECHIVFVIRNPIESALSQRYRYGKDKKFHMLGETIDEGLLLWWTYMRAALIGLQRKTILVDYSEFLKKPSSQLGRLSRLLCLPLRQAEYEKFLEDFLDGGLQRQRAEEADAKSKMSKTLFSVYNELRKMSSSDSIDFRVVNDLLNVEIMGWKEYARYLSKVYVRSRHHAIENRLELNESKKIIAYNEWSLGNIEKELERAKRIIAFQEDYIDRSKTQFEEAEKIILFQKSMIEQKSEFIACMQSSPFRKFYKSVLRLFCSSKAL